MSCHSKKQKRIRPKKPSGHLYLFFGGPWNGIQESLGCLLDDEIKLAKDMGSLEIAFTNLTH